MQTEEREQTSLMLDDIGVANLLDSASDAIVICEAEGIIRYWNSRAEKIFELPRKRALGQNISDVLHPLLGERTDNAIKILIRDGFWSGTLEHTSKDGRQVAIDCKWSLRREANDKIIAFIGINRDITPLKRKEAELQAEIDNLEQRIKDRTMSLIAAQKELDSFCYSVSHDLRAPLRAIDGFTRMIIRSQGDNFDEETRHKLDVIKNNSRYIDQLIDDLLELSRLSRQEMKTDRLNMTDIATAAWREMNDFRNDRKIEMRLRDLPPCLGDKSLIKKVFFNLLSNAVKFTRNKESADIEVGSYSKTNDNVYYVKDNGIGFNMNYSNKLFGAFQRLHSSDAYEGRGIGLAVVQRIINRHHGRVWADAKENEGACFYFSLEGSG